MSYNSRYEYPPIWCHDAAVSNSLFYNMMPNTDNYFKYNRYFRKRVRDIMKRRYNSPNSFKEMIRDGVFDCIIYKSDVIVLQRDHTILNELPEFFNKRNKTNHERRIEISKIAMRGVKRKRGDENICLPSDLVPTICAFAVPGSKIYEYM